MENAVDAMYIAGAVLLMLVALTVSISSFSTQIAKVEEIVQADERIDVVTTTDASGDTEFLNYITYNKSTRDVGVETIVNSLYRSYKENYTVYIKLNSYTPDLNSSDLIEYAKKQQIGPDGNPIINVGNKILVFKITTEYNLQNAKEKLNNVLATKNASTYPDGLGLYNRLKNGNSFTEYIGTLYQNDIDATGVGGEMPEGLKDVSDANKTRIRIITYVEQ